MRIVFVFGLLLLTACRQEESSPNASIDASNQDPSAPLGAELQVFAGAGKDRLCIGGAAAPAAIITYAADGRANCSARGRVEEQQGRLFFLPLEDDSCRIELRRDGQDRIATGESTVGCSYYCGPGARLEGKTFQRLPTPEPVTDLAGDPLC